MLLYPSDEFGEQELPTADIPPFVRSYLSLDAGSRCHLMAKVEVNGKRTDAVWRRAKISFPGDVEWNFDGIFLWDREGEAVARYTATDLERIDGDLRFLVLGASSR